MIFAPSLSTEISGASKTEGGEHRGYASSSEFTIGQKGSAKIWLFVTHRTNFTVRDDNQVICTRKESFGDTNASGWLTLYELMNVLKRVTEEMTFVMRYVKSVAKIHSGPYFCIYIFLIRVPVPFSRSVSSIILGSSRFKEKDVSRRHMRVGWHGKGSHSVRLNPWFVWMWLLAINACAVAIFSV